MAFELDEHPSDIVIPLKRRRCRLRVSIVGRAWRLCAPLGIDSSAGECIENIDGPPR